jgi:hypothetical protein
MMRRSLTLCASTATLCLAVGAPLAPQVISSASAATMDPSPPGRCGPPADTVPPQVTSLTLSRSAVDVAHGPNTVGVIARATDTSGSAVASGVKVFLVTLARGRNTSKTVHLALASGTAAGGTWRGTIHIPRFASDGAWTLTAVDATDAAGNGQFYSEPITGTGAPNIPTDIRRQPTWDRFVTVTGSSRPRKPGRLVGFTLSPRSVNTTHHARTVRVSATFAGTNPKSLLLDLDTGPPSFVGGRLRRPSGNNWTGQLTIPRWLGDSAARVFLIPRYASNVKPSKVIGPEQLAARNLPHNVTIVSRVDRTPPKLNDFTVTPSSVDVSSQAQRLTVTAKAQDRQSGIAGIRFDAHSTSGDVRFSTGAALTRHGNVWTGHATVPRCVVGGTWHVDAFVTNHAFGQARYRFARLARHPFTSTLSVTSIPGDVRSPTAAAEITASGTDHTMTLRFSEGVKNVTASTLSVFALQPAATRFQNALPITAITCANSSDVPVDCSGSPELVTSATLHVPDLTTGQRYELYANQGSVTSQLTDEVGNPADWTRSMASGFPPIKAS